MLKIWSISYIDGHHEPEMDLFVHGDNPRPSTTEARQYLLNVQELIGDPDHLKIEMVAPLETLHDIEGNPYKIIVQE